VLVTGASGFIGSCLARDLLERGDEVHLLLREGSKLWRLQDRIKDFHVHHVDLSDRSGVSSAIEEIRPANVFHLAAYGAYPHQSDPDKSIETNFRGTVNITDACAGKDLSFINVSSSSEYGRKGHPMREDDKLEPDGIYGITKAAGTLYCSHMAREKGMRITTFRVFAAYGYYEDKARLIPSLVLPFLKGESPRLSSPDSVRDFIFIEDLTDAFRKASMTDLPKGSIFNLGTGVQHNIGEVAAIARELTGSEKDVLWGSIEKKRIEPGTWVADMSNTKQAMGWTPKYDLKSGLKKTISWFKKNLDLYG